MSGAEERFAARRGGSSPRNASGYSGSLAVVAACAHDDDASIGAVVESFTVSGAACCSAGRGGASSPRDASGASPSPKDAITAAHGEGASPGVFGARFAVCSGMGQSSGCGVRFGRLFELRRAYARSVVDGGGEDGVSALAISPVAHGAGMRFEFPVVPVILAMNTPQRGGAYKLVRNDGRCGVGG